MPPRPAIWEEQAFDRDREIRDDEAGVVYRVIRLLGRGGMGEVYEVARVDTGARFAMKCLQLQFVGRTKTIERTRREAQLLRELRHPNVVRVHATGVRDDGLIWMIMDLLVGHTLGQVGRALGRCPIPWALGIGRLMCDGLEAVHRYAVHRDIKPENVHLGDDAVVRVLDLGVGKFHRRGLLTTGGVAPGTVPYMSAEQLARPETIDARSDLFSTGLVLAELLGGVHPLTAAGVQLDNVFAVVQILVKGPPITLRATAPWAPAYVQEVVDKALAQDRERRYASAAELGAALGWALGRLTAEHGASAPLSVLVTALAGAHASRGMPTADAGATTGVEHDEASATTVER